MNQQIRRESGQNKLITTTQGGLVAASTANTLPFNNKSQSQFNAESIKKGGTPNTLLGVQSTLDFLQVVRNLSDLNNVVVARANLGLGSIATHNSTDYLSITGGTVTGTII